MQVYIETLGEQTRVGSIDNSGAFQYAKPYLVQNGRPISISLPLKETPYTEEESRGFFESLLPEGFTRSAVANWLHVDSSDYLSLLKKLGNECLGAIRVVSEDAETLTPSYEKLSAEEVRDLAAEGATCSTQLVVAAHLSLTGASGKVGLYFGEDGHWYLPKGDAPSTHIVKQSHVRLRQIVLNERLCLATAQKLGITIPKSFIIDMGDGADEDILFATERYDRLLAPGNPKIGAFVRPYRLHQEDFAQAMGIHAAHKYERPGGHYLEKMFRLIEANVENPIDDSMALWRMIIFDYLIGNTDNHIKNFSLLYSPDLKTVHLAPAYDIISTMVYKNATSEMGFAVGGERDLTRMTRRHFEKAAADIGMGKNLAMRTFDDMVQNFKPALIAAEEELCGNGFEKAEMIAGKILRIHRDIFG